MVRPEIDGQEGEALTQNISLIDVSADSLARYCKIIEPGQMSSAPVVTQPLSDAATAFDIFWRSLRPTDLVPQSARLLPARQPWLQPVDLGEVVGTIEQVPTHLNEYEIAGR